MPPDVDAPAPPSASACCCRDGFPHMSLQRDPLSTSELHSSTAAFSAPARVAYVTKAHLRSLMIRMDCTSPYLRILEPNPHQHNLLPSSSNVEPQLVTQHAHARTHP